MTQLVFTQDKSFENKLNIKTRKIELIKSGMSQIRNKIQKEDNLVVVLGGEDSVNRFAVENKKVDILLSPENNNKRDFLFFRNSGLNQVLCKFAHKNNVAIGFNFSDLLDLNSTQRSKVLARMAQNVKLCKKYDVKMIFSTFANDKYYLRSDTILASFAKILGI